MAGPQGARPGLTPINRLLGGYEAREARSRAMVLGLFNVFAASLAAAGQWAAWRSDRSLDLEIAGADWWRPLAVFTSNLLPAAVAVVLVLRRSGVLEGRWRRRLAIVGVAALASAAVRLGLLTTLRYSPPDLSFVVIEMVFGVLAVAVGIGLALYDYDLGEEFRAVERQRAVEAERAAQAARRAEQASLEARREVARHLHGGVQQRLVMLSHRMERLAADEGMTALAAARLRDLAEDFDEIREHEVRELSHSLVPVGIDIGLREAMFVALGRLPSAVSTSVTFDPTILDGLEDPDRPRLAVTDRLLMLGVMQEGVTNAVRHGDAGRIDVHLGIDLRDGVELTLSVDDDGRGLAGHAAPASGLGHLRDRLRRRGGSLVLTERAEGGCRLAARLPLVESTTSPATAKRVVDRPDYRPLSTRTRPVVASLIVTVTPSAVIAGRAASRPASHRSWAVSG